MTRTITTAYFERFTVDNKTYTLKKLPSYPKPKYRHRVIGLTDINWLDFEVIHDSAKLLSHYTPIAGENAWKFLRLKVSKTEPYLGILLLCDYELFLTKLLYHISVHLDRTVLPSDVERIMPDLKALTSDDVIRKLAVQRMRGVQSIYTNQTLSNDKGSSNGQKK